MEQSTMHPVHPLGTRAKILLSSVFSPYTVDDEYDPGWKLEGMRQTIKYALLLFDHLNRNRIVPRWKGGLTFPLEADRR